jgi:formate dehydrogenase major subunit
VQRGPRMARGSGEKGESKKRAHLRVLGAWPLVRQIVDRQPRGLDGTAASPRTRALRPRTEKADRVVRSVCPYCAVGCGQLVYVRNERITNIEGDPDSPISLGCLCPKGAATFQLVTGLHRLKSVLYREARGTRWEEIPLPRAMEMVAERVKRTRDSHWQSTARGTAPTKEPGEALPVNRTEAIAHLGGATLDNEENYLLKKLYTALGIIQVENQARI